MLMAEAAAKAIMPGEDWFVCGFTTGGIWVGVGDGVDVGLGVGDGVGVGLGVGEGVGVGLGVGEGVGVGLGVGDGVGMGLGVGDGVGDGVGVGDGLSSGKASHCAKNTGVGKGELVCTVPADTSTAVTMSPTLSRRHPRKLCPVRTGVGMSAACIV